MVVQWRKGSAYGIGKNTTDIYSEGRGQGTASEYKPWIYIHDFSSNGIVSRVKGMTIGRIHHLLSNQELWYFYLLDWSEKTIDIREQFPLSELEDAIV